MSVANPDVWQFLTGDREATIDDLISKFPNESPWELRNMRRLFSGRQAVAQGDVSEIDPSNLVGITKLGQLALRAGFFRPQVVEWVERRPVKPLFTKAGYVVVVCGDAHAPDSDAHALDVWLQIAQAVDPNEIILNGDMLDVHALSRYTPSAERPLRWVDERTQGIKDLALIRSTFAKLPIHYLFGNHEYRCEKYVAATAAPLQGLFTLPQILGIDSFNFIHPESNRLLLAEGKLLIKHGLKVRQDAGASVKEEIKDHGMSVVMGHVHRRALIEVFKTVQRINDEPPLIGCELGCLADLRPSYLEVEQTANWQHGGAVVTIYDDDTFDIESIRITDGYGYFRGRRFQSRLGPR